MTTVLIDAALDYAAQGYSVFPCRPRGKEPAIARGFQAATTNPETIKRYWRQSECNIGIRTGAASGFWVLDIDGDQGEASLRALERNYGPLPPTREVITVRGGRHIYFRYRGPISSTASRIAPGIDSRGDGGYVLAPPSIWENGRRYTWSVDSVDEMAIAPGWLLQLARKKPAPPVQSISQQAIATVRGSGSPGAYGQAALERECAALSAMSPNTGRNCALNLAAFRLAQLVAGNELDGGEVFDRLITSSRQNTLVAESGLRAVVATISSGFNAGLKSPRSRGVA
jgi:Bifunctional DNA primase/polymerase, N-terminal